MAIIEYLPLCSSSRHLNGNSLTKELDNCSTENSLRACNSSTRFRVFMILLKCVIQHVGAKDKDDLLAALSNFVAYYVRGSCPQADSIQWILVVKISDTYKAA